MFRVSNAVAAFVLAATVASAAPAAAMPTELPVEAPKATRTKTAGPSHMGAKIERIARTQIGAPYSYGGMTPAGFDCSGFTSWVYSHVGITLPHSSGSQYSLGESNGFTAISDISKLEVGDLVFHGDSGGIQHAGIYVGNNEFISATSSAGVQVRSLFDSYWGPLWVGGVRPTR
jgi:cell wall-associated NlpC family hydrolase